jgi:hypothetical protein
MVHVPRGKPGLGVTVDAEFIESLTTRAEVLRSTSAQVAV